MKHESNNSYYYFRFSIQCTKQYFAINLFFIIKSLQKIHLKWMILSKYKGAFASLIVWPITSVIKYTFRKCWTGGTAAPLPTCRQRRLQAWVALLRQSPRARHLQRTTLVTAAVSLSQKPTTNLITLPLKRNWNISFMWAP